MGEGDLAMPDLAAGSDLSAAADLTVARDLAQPADLATPPDLQMPPADLSVTADLSTPTDLSTPADLSVAMDLAAPPDMATCKGSADCDPMAQYCCADITLGPGIIPACPVTSLSISCRSTCDGNIALMCNVTDRARRCQKAADCAGDPGGYSNCCPVNVGMLSTTVCVTDGIMMLLGCMPLP